MGYPCGCHLVAIVEGIPDLCKGYPQHNWEDIEIGDIQGDIAGDIKKQVISPAISAKGYHHKKRGISPTCRGNPLGQPSRCGVN